MHFHEILFHNSTNIEHVHVKCDKLLYNYNFPYFFQVGH